METTMNERETQTPPADIFGRAVCLSLTMTRLGVRRKVNLSELQPGVKVDPAAIGVSKELLESPELDAILRADKALRSFLDSRTSGPALFKTGVYMLSYDILSEVDAEVEARLAERRDVLVPAFLGAYEKAREDARDRLGALYNAEDYPPASTVAAAFTASTRIFAIGTPDKLAAVRADIFDREREKAAAQWADVIAESRNVLREEFAGLVEHLVERLTPGPDGQPKRFNASLVENLDEFLRTFSARNIADDADLTAVIEQARGVLAGVTPQRLRESSTRRAAVADAFDTIKAAASTLVEKSGRRFAFDGE